jgi:hypothetical protein
MQSARLITYHKQATSARTRFLALGYGGVCAFDGLPRMAQLLEEVADPGGKVAQHPASLVSRAEREWGLARGGLEVDSGFRVLVDIPGGPVEVFLARFTPIDPPFAQAESNGARFIDITQARGMAPAELQLLRLAYEHILG